MVYEQTLAELISNIYDTTNKTLKLTLVQSKAITDPGDAGAIPVTKDGWALTTV